MHEQELAMTSSINERIQNLQLTAAMDGPRGPEWLVLRWEPSSTIKAPELFKYLTEPELLVKWSPVVPNRPLTSTGSATSREHSHSQEVAADVVSVIPPQEVTHRWGKDRLRWRIITGGTASEGARLKLEMELAQPEFASYYAAGWHICLAVLDAVLAGESQERIVGEAAFEYGWKELQKMYWAQLPGQSDEQI